MGTTYGGYKTPIERAGSSFLDLSGSAERALSRIGGDLWGNAMAILGVDPAEHVGEARGNALLRSIPGLNVIPNAAEAWRKIGDYYQNTGMVSQYGSSGIAQMPNMGGVAKSARRYLSNSDSGGQFLE